jgi:hypothetical protein
MPGISTLKLEALLSACEAIGITPEQLTGYVLAKNVAAETHRDNAEMLKADPDEMPVTLKDALEGYKERDIAEDLGADVIDSAIEMQQYVENAP